MLQARWYRPLVDLIFPRICMLCSEPIVGPDQESLCDSCALDIRPTELRCPCCSAPISDTLAALAVASKKCYYCERRKWSFRRAYCYTAYADKAARAARKIKQPTCEPLAIEIGKRIAGWLQTHPPFLTHTYDAIVPVPQHWLRRAALRYNQADVLAIQISKVLQLPIRRHWLYRTRWTEKQGTKTIEERRTGPLHSFDCKPRKELAGASILVVDDIVTSGATAHEASQALRQAGVMRVDIAAFARGVGVYQQKKTPPEPAVG